MICVGIGTSRKCEIIHSYYDSDASCNGLKTSNNKYELSNSGSRTN